MMTKASLQVKMQALILSCATIFWFDARENTLYTEHALPARPGSVLSGLHTSRRSIYCCHAHTLLHECSPIQRAVTAMTICFMDVVEVMLTYANRYDA